jgi:hypothetical protein
MGSREEEQLRRQVRLEEAHVERVPGLRDEGVLGAGRTIATEVIRVAAAVTADHIAPGDQTAAARVGEMLLTAFDTAAKLADPASGPAGGPVGGPAGGSVAVADGRFSLGLDGNRAAGRPSVEVVHEVAAEVAVDGGPGSGRRGTGVVIWGSAADIGAAAGTGVLDAAVLLSWARKQAFGKIYAGVPDAAAAAMRAVRDLEVLVLLDPGIGGGLWVDVDPVTQAPAATLLIEMTIPVDPVEPAALADPAAPAGRGQTFRVLRP